MRSLFKLPNERITAVATSFLVNLAMVPLTALSYRYALSKVSFILLLQCSVSQRRNFFYQPFVFRTNSSFACTPNTARASCPMVALPHSRCHSQPGSHNDLDGRNPAIHPPCPHPRLLFPSWYKLSPGSVGVGHPCGARERHHMSHDCNCYTPLAPAELRKGMFGHERENGYSADEIGKRDGNDCSSE